MANQHKASAVFTVHNEIVDWFLKLVNENCASHLHIQPKPDNGHFTTPIEIEIGGDEAQLDNAMDFIHNTSEITRFKMPWLNDFTYYVVFPEQKESIEEQLKIMKMTNYALTYNYTTLIIIRSRFYVFHFRSGLDDDEKFIIDEMFKSKAGTSLFLPYPHKMVNRTQSALDIHILTAFHGNFLLYLSFEDILSLEMVNTRCNNLCWDEDLNHDIQQFLREHYSLYYTGDKTFFADLREFRSSEVLRYAIKKFHTSIKHSAIPNILPVDEIRTLSHLYNIQLYYHDIIHIDFKGINEKVNFCAIYHHEPIPTTFLYYGSKYATQNYSVNFNVDGSLDSQNDCTEFLELIVKTDSTASPLETNAVLKYVADNFMAGQFPNTISQLTLYEFDLNLVPTNILRSLTSMMREGQLVFEKINFNSNKFIAILGQADGNRLELKRCQINMINNMEEFPYHSKTKVLRFCDMDLELNAITILKNVELLDIFGCRIHNNLSKLERPEPPNEIKQCACDIGINSCTFSLGDRDEPWHFTVGHNLWFGNSEIKLKTIFQILQNCEIQNQIIFDNCHLRFEHDQFEHFSPKPVELIFKNTTVDSFAMHTILGKLPNKSKVWFVDCYIFPIDEYIDEATNATIRIEYIELIKCRFETQTLLNVLGKMSSTAEIHIESCNLLLNFDLVYRSSSVSLSNLNFEDMCLDSKQLITLLNILDQNSVVNFSRCEITNPCTELYNFNQESEITIGLINMFVDLQMFIFKHKRWMVLLKNCQLKFDTELIPNNLIESIVIFDKITFDSADHLKLFANFSETSGIVFKNCDFDFTRLHLIPNIMIKPRCFNFQHQSFDLEVLVTILERISDETMVNFVKCDVELVGEVFSIRPIKIKRTAFENMQLDVAIFLRIAKNFDSFCGIGFKNCKFVCPKPYELPNITLRLKSVLFVDMEFDVNLFKIIVQKLSETAGVVVENCDFTTVPEQMLSNESVDLGHIEFYNVDYSPGFLQCLQQLNDKCIVEYDGELPNRAFIDICSKTPVHGDRLLLLSHDVTGSVYFELFAEYFQLLSQDLDFETEYDLPTHLIPYTKPVELRYSWDEFKVKLVSVNDVTLKLEFLWFGEPIDLFYLLNDLSDDSDDEFIDHS